MVTPVTTLIQQYANQLQVDALVAETAVQTALGLGGDVNLLQFDPFAQTPGDTTALQVQRSAAQVAELGNVMQAGGIEFSTIITTLAASIQTGKSLDLADAGSLQQVLGDVAPAGLIEQATAVNSAIGSTQTLPEIANLQEAQGSGGEIWYGTGARDSHIGTVNADVLYGLGGMTY